MTNTYIRNHIIITQVRYLKTFHIKTTIITSFYAHTYAA